jgi:hypothetical protein
VSRSAVRVASVRADSVLSQTSTAHCRSRPPCTGPATRSAKHVAHSTGHTAVVLSASAHEKVRPLRHKQQFGVLLTR